MFYRSSKLLPLVILQIIRRSIAQSASLPQNLADITPPCAVPCLESTISSGFQTNCQDILNLNCLCTHTTSTDWTLGEVALQCLVENCQAHDSINATSIYNICSGVKGALIPTIATMIVTITETTPSTILQVTSSTVSSPVDSPASIVVSTSFTGVSSLVFDSGTPPILPSTRSIASSIPTSIPTSSVSSSSPSGQSSATTYIPQPASQSSILPAPTASKTKLSNGQIIGLAVGGFAISCLAIGILFFMFCMRRKNKQRRRSQRWSGDLHKQLPRTPPRRPNPTDSLSKPNSNIAFPEVYSQRFYAPSPTEEKRNSSWRTSIDPEEIGIAVSPEGVQHQHSSPSSFSSQRTTSQLLPAMPAINLWPAPLKTRRSLIPEEATSGREHTIIEEKPYNNNRAPQGMTIPTGGYNFNLARNEERKAGPSRVIYFPSVDPRAQMYALERAKKSPASAPIPLTPTYDNGNPTPTLTQGDFQRWKSPVPETRQEVIPPVPAIRYSTLEMPNLQRSSSRSQPNFSVRDTTSNPAWHSVPSDLPAYPPPTRREPELPNNSERRPIPLTRSSSRYSSSSEVTNFELDEDSTPEHEAENRLQAPVLSPVIESPAANQPSFTRDVRTSNLVQYPRIPRPTSVSKHAEEVHRPKASAYIDTTGDQPPRPTRDQLVRNSESFLTSKSSSSGTTNSSLLAKRRGDQTAGQMLQGGLKLDPNLVNGQRNKRWKVTQMEGEQQQRPQLSLDTRGAGIENRGPSMNKSIGLTPTRRGDDLFLTVN